MVQVLFRLNRGVDGEKLAKNAIRAHPADSGAIYDALFNYYVQSKRLGDAEGLLRAENAREPGDATAKTTAGRLLSSNATRLRRNFRPQRNFERSQRFPDGHALVGDFYQSRADRMKHSASTRSGLKARPKTNRYIKSAWCRSSWRRESAPMLSRNWIRSSRKTPPMSTHVRRVPFCCVKPETPKNWNSPYRR